MHQTHLFFFIFMVLSGCKENKYKLEEELPVYQVNIEERHEVSVFDLFSDIEIIPLETKEESLIA